MQELRDALPLNVRLTDTPIAVTPDGAHTYFVNAAGDIIHYDRAKNTTRIGGSGAFDLGVSPVGNALAYVKTTGRHNDAFVWIQTLNPGTGLPTGAERQLSTHRGDVPSISPDGKLVAFARDDSSGVGQSIVVVPIEGGAERVVAPALPSTVANIRWTPDGKTLYFGVNQPVACVPEWSCLPLAGANRAPTGSIRRVAVSGGPVTVIANPRGLWPGLSPDGTTLVYIDTTANRRYVVADASGRRRDTFTLPNSQTAFGWIRGATLLVSSGGSAKRLQSLPLAGGEPRTLMETADAAGDPVFAPDGKTLSVMFRGSPRTELRILALDGTVQKTLPLPENFAQWSVWSPDGKWILYTGFGDAPPAHLALVERATGKTQKLYDLGPDAASTVRWLPDSRGIVVTEMLGGTGKDRHAVVHQIDLAGKVSVLRDVPLGPAPSAAVPLDDARALVQRGSPGDVRVIPLGGSGSERTVLAVTGGYASAPLLSPDGDWFAMRRNPASADGSQAKLLELARVDGSSHTTIELPFNAAAGTNPRLGPGARDLIVMEARRQDVDPGVYVVNAGTKAVKKLFTYAAQNAFPEIAFAPDGKSIAYLAWQTLPPGVFMMDVSSR